jgi:hypothetical protein
MAVNDTSGIVCLCLGHPMMRFSVFCLYNISFIILLLRMFINVSADIIPWAKLGAEGEGLVPVRDEGLLAT